jgi:hypothetical protein
MLEGRLIVSFMVAKNSGDLKTKSEMEEGK